MIYFAVNIGHEHPGCGISDSVQSWMDQIQHNGEPSAILNATEEYDDNVEVPLHFGNEEQVGPAYKYSEQGNVRRKRSLPNPSPKKSCSLYIQVGLLTTLVYFYYVCLLILQWPADFPILFLQECGKWIKML